MNMESVYYELESLLSGYLPNILGAVGILIVGWLLAYLCMGLFRGILRKLKVDQNISKTAFGNQDKKLPIEKWAGRAVFVFIMLVVLMGFFQVLGLSGMNDPLNRFLETIASYIPRLIAPLVLFFVAWVIASSLRFIIVKSSEKLKIEERIKSLEDKPHEGNLVSKTFAEIVYWLVFLLFLPAVLDSLAMTGLLGPVSNMVDKLLGFLPNLFAALAIFGLGWLVAKVVQKIVVNFMNSLGVNKVAEKVGLSKVVGDLKLADIIGTVVYILILIPIAIAGLNALRLDAVTDPASDMLSSVLIFIPALFSAAIIILLAYIIGKILCDIFANFLQGVGFDNVLVKLGISADLSNEKYSPSQVAGIAALITIMLFASIEALNVVGFDKMATILSNFTIFLGHVVFGLLVLALGLYLANVVAKLVKSSTSPHANILSIVCRVAIITLAGSMALEQMAISNDIVITAFGLVLAGAALAFGIAFGLGGREEASKFISNMINKLK